MTAGASTGTMRYVGILVTIISLTFKLAFAVVRGFVSITMALIRAVSR